MKSIIKALTILLMTTFIFSGCNLGAQAPQAPTIDVAAESTKAFETISVTLTLGALGQLQTQPTHTLSPTQVPLTATEEPLPTLLPTVLLPTEIISTETPVPTLTPDTPMLRVTESSNCRAGPSPMYGVEGYITTDMNLPVRGINIGHSWWFVDNPTYPGYHCWVWKWTSVVEGDVSKLPVYFDPWTPTPGMANITAGITSWTGNLYGKCPMKMTAVAVIRSDQGGQVKYQWVKRGGVVVGKGWVTVAADGSAVVSVSFKVNHTGNGIVQLQVVYPTRVNSGRVNYSATCTK